MEYTFVAVIATFGRNVLIGQSGRYVMDGLSGEPLQTIIKAQRFPALEDTLNARNDAMVLFEAYAYIHKYNVGEISWKPADARGPARYSTKYIRRTNPNPPGFIKGTVIPPSADHVFLRQKAIDEFKEEVGIQLEDTDLIETSQPNVFVVDMVPLVERKQYVIDAWNETRPFTELVHLEWVNRDALPQLNEQSQSIHHLIPSVTGGRR